MTDVVPKGSWQLAEPRSGRGPFPYPDGRSGPCSPWSSTLSPGESCGFRPGIPAPSAPSSASARRRLHPPGRVPPGGREQVTWTNASPFRAGGGGWRQRSLGGLLTGGTRALLAWLLFQASSPSATLYLVPWRLCPSRAQFREATRRRPWPLIGRGGSFPARFPLPFSTSVPLSAGASFLPGVTPIPMPAAAPAPCRFPAARPSVTGRVRRAEPL